VRAAVVVLCGFAVVGCGDGSTHVFPEGGYTKLSQTGLYSDIAGKELAADILPYTVAHVLWTDGAVKSRFLRLPAGTQIDTSDIDHWELPVGAQLFKQFVRDGVLIETRLIERTGDTGVREDDYWRGAFLWQDDERDAVFVPDGAENARGTDHDVPSTTDCWRCHRGQPGTTLGLAMVQLSHGGAGETVKTLSEKGLLSRPPSTEYVVPGDEVTSAALGYLHANCAHCHNPRGIGRPYTNIRLELSVDETSPEDTQIYATTVDVPLQYWTEFRQMDFDLRIVPGDPDASGLVYRMGQRSPDAAMPPLGTELVHADGVGLVRDWILSL